MYDVVANEGAVAIRGDMPVGAVRVLVHIPRHLDDVDKLRLITEMLSGPYLYWMNPNVRTGDDMVPRDNIVEWLNSIRWLSQAGVTDDAQMLIDKHLVLIRPLIHMLMTDKHLDASLAHGLIFTAGHNSACGQSLLDELFARVTFEGANVREPMIAIVTAAYCWESDQELNRMINPWPPLIELIGLGYACSFNDDIDLCGVTLWVGYREGIDKYRVV